MTDSGFSSAASQRSTSSIVRPAHINSFSSSLKPNLFTIPPEKEEKDGVREDALPKPCMRPAVPNRLIYGKNYGGYSPNVSPYSNQEMSPMSSLTYDFKDLSTSNTSNTPRKRLSLSSLSSLESPHPSSASFFGCSSTSQISPPSSSAVSSISSSSGISGDGSSSGTQTPTPDDNKENQPTVKSKDVSNYIHRKVKSIPLTKGRPRLLGVKEGQEKIRNKDYGFKPPFRKSRTAGGVCFSDSPMGLSDNFSPIGIGKVNRRTQHHGAGSLMSSPLVGGFSHGKSSAFKPVSPNEAATKVVHRRALADISSNVPSKIRSPQRSDKPSGTKRFLDESLNTSSVTCARKKKCSKSLNAKTAFLQERKTKSADAIVTGRPLPHFANPDSPISDHCFIYRPTSAPVLMGNDDDDDYVLSHSSLCSHDSDDEELKLGSSGEGFSTVSSNREDDIENMMTENMKEYHSSDAERFSSDAPSALDGLISGALLLQGSVNISTTSSNCVDDSIGALNCGKGAKNDNALKPRGLFRSPSAPPLMPSRKALMKLKRAGRNGDRSANDGTPVSIKRQRTFASLSEQIKSPEVVDPGLNRSRSYNELDIMKAVDQGCQDQNLVGDFTRPCTLPTVSGRKQDLKYISATTLSEVLKEQHGVGMVEIVDCRYTYEYDGGHIDGALNIYSEEQLVERFFDCARPLWARAKQHQAQSGDCRPHIVVFHCEFSSERAPKLARYLRKIDRKVNAYPNLHYPEIYILKDGYKEFFKAMKEHCEPCSYIPMSHEDYSSELRKFRAKSKTWAGEKSKLGLFNRFKSK